MIGDVVGPGPTTRPHGRPLACRARPGPNLDSRSLGAAVLAVAAVALAGCGGSSRHGATTHGTTAASRTTVPAYGTFPPDTISVTSTNPTSPACRLEAQALARNSRLFLTRSPADTYYMVMREELTDIEARRCSPALLGDALDRGLSEQQRRALIASLPRRMANIVRASLAATGS